MAVTGQQEEMVWVLRTPTQAMIDAAWEGALAEDARTVWSLMLEEFERGRTALGTVTMEEVCCPPYEKPKNDP